MYFVETDKNIEVADNNHVTVKQKGQVRIKICNNNEDNFIAIFHNVILAPDLCDRLCSILTLINLVNTCLFLRAFCMVYLGAKEKNLVTLPHNAHRKRTLLGGIKQMSKTKKLPSRKKIALELLHQILGHRSTISLLAGYNANFWKDIELRIYIDPFCTSCQISSMKKKAGS